MSGRAKILPRGGGGAGGRGGGEVLLTLPLPPPALRATSPTGGRI